jgi:hypothetical protein
MNLLYFTQAVSTASALIEFFGAIVFLCYIARNWPPEMNKLRYQLSFSLFLVFVTAAARDFFSTYAWWAGDQLTVEYVQQWRLVIQIPKLGQIAGLLIAIRAITFEIYGNRLALALMLAMGLVFVSVLFFQPLFGAGIFQ